MPAPSAQSTATGSKRRPHAAEGEQEAEARSRASPSPSLPRVYSSVQVARQKGLQADLLQCGVDSSANQQREKHRLNLALALPFIALKHPGKYIVIHSCTLNQGCPYRKPLLK
ncbi:uncharacterized protein LOC119287766 isoform X3 [Triticum dicoccoides]|uniref:uncharacterized protein LOC119287766 isoform X3 n=1 Tax=Triticum dicoccoides TaxID=85692 RepID=UPI00188DF34B|nr:uncharacterized protein LOC119287766 isoform X3 [Triticum dicoccoides]XP_044366107.1 uncharacterized protein LOC123088025 isoform X3 [Triticum aestivum]